MKKIFSWMLGIWMALAVVCVGYAAALDYADPENWAVWENEKTHAADVFFVAPTVDLGKDGRSHMDVTDAAMREKFLAAIRMEQGIYDETADFYAPYYRQMTLSYYGKPEAEREAPLAVSYEDVRAAFQHFLSQEPERPLILAGFSQGGDMVLRLMKEFGADSRVKNHLVAAYILGWRVTDADLAAYPHLRMAKGAADTGCIVSFNTEAKGIEESLLVPRGVRTLSINPLNWRTDGTVASRFQNLGACFFGADGEMVKETPFLTGAYIDGERGTLIATDIVPADYHNKIFPDGVYHLYDYMFFYRNLQENVRVRTQAFLRSYISSLR